MNIVKMAILPKMIDRFNIIPIKILEAFFDRTRRSSSKIYIKPNEDYNSQRKSEQQEQNRRHCDPRIQDVIQSYSN